MNATQDDKSVVVNRLAAFFGHPEGVADEQKERDHAGKFKNGNRGGPGNPFARRVAKLRQAMLEECAEEDLRAVTRAMIDAAKRGDVAAARLVYQYALGKPQKIVDPDRVDEDEFKVMQGIAVAGKMFDVMLNAMPADTVNRLLQALWPMMMKATAKQVDQEIEEKKKRDQEIEEMDAAYEALPAEEKLKYYAAGGLTPPDELVEQAEKERAARQQTASESDMPPSPNGPDRGDKSIDLSERERGSMPSPSPNGPIRSTNGVAPGPNAATPTTNGPAGRSDAARRAV